MFSKVRVCPPTPPLPFALAVWSSWSWDFSSVTNLRSAYVTSSLVISGKVTGEFKSLVAPTGETGIRFRGGSNERSVSLGVNRVIHAKVRRGFWLILKDFMTQWCWGVVYVKRRLRTVFTFPVGNRARKSHSSQFLEQMHRVTQFVGTSFL